MPRLGELLASALEQYRGSGALHDPNTIAFLEAPALYTMRNGRVTVVQDGEQIGRTVIREGDGPHSVAFDVHADGFFESLLANLTRVSRES